VHFERDFTPTPDFGSSLFLVSLTTIFIHMLTITLQLHCNRLCKILSVLLIYNYTVQKLMKILLYVRWKVSSVWKICIQLEIIVFLKESWKSTKSNKRE
jgi:hypothetical protein